MPRISLTLLGPFQAFLDGKAITVFESNKVRALLAFLAVEGYPQPREKLAGLLWPEWPENAARNNLRYALANLRHVIGDRDSENPLLCISRQDIQLVPGDALQVDARDFAALVEQPGHAPENLEAAIKLYHGRFLESFSIPDSTPFEEWALLKREFYDRHMLDALYRLAAVHEKRGEYTQALELAWRQVELEPWREEAQQQLMRLLAMCGQRSAALAQYEACRRTLTRELGVEPSHETTGLYEQIRDGGLGAADQLQLTREESPGQDRAPVVVRIVPAAQESLAPPEGRSRDWLRHAPLILGVLSITMIAIVLIALFSGVTGSSLFNGGRSTPITVKNVTQPATGKLAIFCEDLQGMPHICIGGIGNSGAAYPLPKDLPFKDIWPLFAWSPDGSQIALSARPDISQPGESGLKVFAINADGSNIRQITTGNTDDILQDWSYDGEWISFNREKALWACRPDGSDVHPILQGDYDVLTSSWSPDSQRLAFLSRNSGNETALYEIWAIQPDGSSPYVLYSFDRHVEACQISWSPDGLYVGCICAFSQEEEVKMLLDASGSEPPQSGERIMPSWFSNYWPRWENP